MNASDINNNPPDRADEYESHLISMIVRFGSNLPIGRTMDTTFIKHRAPFNARHNVTLRQHAISLAMQSHDAEDHKIMRLLTQFREWGLVNQYFKRGRWVWCYQWGRDCDQMEADSIELIPATLEAFEAAENAMYESAEGPCFIHLISPQQADEYQPHRRDRAAEQMGY